VCSSQGNTNNGGVAATAVGVGAVTKQGLCLGSVTAPDFSQLGVERVRGRGGS